MLSVDAPNPSLLCSVWLPGLVVSRSRGSKHLLLRRRCIEPGHDNLDPLGQGLILDANDFPKEESYEAVCSGYKAAIPSPS